LSVKSWSSWAALMPGATPKRLGCGQVGVCACHAAGDVLADHHRHRLDARHAGLVAALVGGLGHLVGQPGVVVVV
jgi:hypothetical protein